MTPSHSASNHNTLLPRLTRNEAQARNLLAQRARNRVLPLGGEPWLASLEPWLPGISLSAPGPNDWLIGAQWAGAPFDVRLPAGAVDALVASQLQNVELPALPDEFAAAALEAALAPITDALMALQRGPARIERVWRQPVEARALQQTFGLTLRHGAQVIHGSLATDALGLMLLAGLVAALAPVPNDLNAGTLPLLLRAEIGQSWLAAPLLTSIAPGDALLMQDCWIAQDGELRLSVGNVGLRVRWNDCQLVVTQTLNSEGLPMPAEIDGPSSPNDHAVRTLAQDVPVRLSFDLGERILTLAELQALQVGQALELGRPLAGGVNVRANGALIGTGELVEIDGQLGVVLASIFQASAVQPGAQSE